MCGVRPRTHRQRIATTRVTCKPRKHMTPVNANDHVAILNVASGRFSCAPTLSEVAQAMHSHASNLRIHNRIRLHCDLMILSRRFGPLPRQQSGMPEATPIPDPQPIERPIGMRPCTWRSGSISPVEIACHTLSCIDHEQAKQANSGMPYKLWRFGRMPHEALVCFTCATGSPGMGNARPRRRV